MKSSTDRYELATRTLRRYNLTPTIGSPELTALLAMLRGHIDDVTARAQRTVDRQHVRAEAINLGLDVVWARGGAGRG